MIPTLETVTNFWDEFDYPKEKRLHATWVSRTAMILAEELRRRGYPVDLDLLEKAALLHDIDKNMRKIPGDSHPDAGVRMLLKRGMGEVAQVVRTHPLHTILDPATSPRTWEEKILYLADKMVKYELIGVDKRFDLWRSEHLPEKARRQLEDSYPLVKKLEKELFDLTGLTPEKLAQLARTRYT